MGLYSYDNRSFEFALTGKLWIKRAFFNSKVAHPDHIPCDIISLRGELRRSTLFIWNNIWFWVWNRRSIELKTLSIMKKSNNQILIYLLILMALTIVLFRIFRKTHGIWLWHTFFIKNKIVTGISTTLYINPKPYPPHTYY